MPTTFKTKQEAVKYFKAMLNKYEIGQAVDADDCRDLVELVHHHKHAVEKIGCGVSGFAVVKEELYGHRRFEIIRVDGSRCDFSYLKCISPPAEGHHFKEVMVAFRTEVLEQTRGFHNAAFQNCSLMPCSITGEMVGRDNSHVDHAEPKTFQVLVKAFLAAFHLHIDNIATHDDGRFPGYSARYIADAEIAENWRDYHRKHAMLRITSATANLELPKTKVTF